ncbi:MAG: hypothetical protein CMJ49_13220 [Planctomycetaceae bacterium]|nr:hypothetical protein [Planctomycetaceae bacterium]
MATLTNYKGLQVPDTTPGAGGDAIKDNFTALADRIGPVDYTATAPPGAGDDDTQGFEIGSRWIDVTGDEEYVCVDNTTASAVWRKTSAHVTGDLVDFTTAVSGHASVSANTSARHTQNTDTGTSATGFEVDTGQNDRTKLTAIGLERIGTAANLSLIVKPKGTGAFQIDDNGNTRGANAVDLQASRTNDANVASGASSVVMGNDNRSTGIADVAIGSANTVEGIVAGFAAGVGNQVDGFSGIALGSVNEANATISLVSGQEAVAEVFGQMARAAGKFSAVGDAQISTYVLRRRTTDATANVELTADKGAPGAENRLAVPSDRMLECNITVIAHEEGGADAACWRRLIILHNDGGTTSQIGSTDTIGIDANTPGWGFNLFVDDTNDVLQIRVTGQAAKTIRWLGRIETVELGF